MPEHRAAVFAPAPLFTVTVEARGDEPELHVHAGGQGFWQARMVAALGVRTRLCGSFGGETGFMVRHLVEREGVDVVAVEVAADNPGYVHDRRGGSRQAIVETAPSPLSRHELDQLYGAMLVEGLEAGVSLLGGGTRAGSAVAAEAYGRLAADLAANDRNVVVDLAGDHLEAVAPVGVAVLKLSDEELVASGRASSAELPDVLSGVEELGRSARMVVVTRADEPAVACIEGEMVEVLQPRLHANDPRGAGDSMTAGIAASLARGCDLATSLRIGTAAGALNVTRRGLATGAREEIFRMSEHVELRALRR